MSSDKSNRIGALYVPILDDCPRCKGGLCMEAKNKDRDFPCSGGHFQSCGVYIKLKNGGTI